jgi:hypothetical protein
MLSCDSIFRAFTLAIIQNSYGITRGTKHFSQPNNRKSENHSQNKNYQISHI